MLFMLILTDENPQFSLIVGLIYEGWHKCTSSTTRACKESFSFGNELEISLITTTYTLQIGWDYNYVIDLIFKKCQLNIGKKFNQNNLLLLELSNSLSFFWSLVRDIICWKHCFSKIVTCWSCSCLLEEVLLFNYLLEMMFSNSCYLLKELFSSCYCWCLGVVVVTTIIIDAIIKAIIVRL
jgi:hypothetical protein